MGGPFPSETISNFANGTGPPPAPPASGRGVKRVQENSDRQPRRNRLSRHQDRAPHGHRDRRRLFRRRRPRALRADGRRRGAYPAVAGVGILSTPPPDPRGGASENQTT